VSSDDRYIIMANHQSALDIPVLMATLPARWRSVFWAKKSLFKIPVLGTAMRSLGHMPVDRVNRLKAGQMLSDSRHRIRDTRSTLVFPEETYGPADDLLPFQRGGFLLALKTGIPILPVGVTGTRVALPPDGRLVTPTRLGVRFGQPIATTGLTVGDRDDLMDRTRTAIRELLAIGMTHSEKGQ
jgi:1-acyl-sn-glycerol-3-phosphate acyltransferase